MQSLSDRGTPWCELLRPLLPSMGVDVAKCGGETRTLAPGQLECSYRSFGRSAGFSEAPNSAPIRQCIGAESLFYGALPAAYRCVRSRRGGVVETSRQRQEAQ